MGGSLLAYLYLWVLPHIADYRSTIENLLSPLRVSRSV